MNPTGDLWLAAAVGANAARLAGERGDFDPLLRAVGDARIVLLGEASHGTHEFYRARAEITARLIIERGFAAVAVEADWPDAYRANRFVQGARRDPDARAALADFTRFPRWMWRNLEVLAFLSWLRGHNGRLPPGAPRVGFYGLDLYSLHASMAAVIEYLDRVDPEAARRARERYACFEDLGEDPQAYGQAAGLELARSCEEEVVAELRELQRRRAELLTRDRRLDEDEYFQAQQNARLVKDAEEYYRGMFQGRASTWNLRDTHMADTLDALRGYLGQRRHGDRIVVWAHNSHVGDARFTSMGGAGEINLGQLVRERHGDAAFLVGFTTHAGTVSAASGWGGAVERKTVRASLPHSYERLFHETTLGDFVLGLRDLGGELDAALSAPRLERAIGVVYKPETERASHYLAASLPRQFDAVVHYDATRAVEPLEPTAAWQRGELPETYPEGW